MLAERERRAEKDFALVIEPLKGREPAVGGAVAVGPVVVAGVKTNGALEELK